MRLNLTAPEGYFTEEEMARLLNLTVATLRPYHSKGKNNVPPRTKIGQTILYNKDSFDLWLKSKEQNYDKRTRSNTRSMARR